MTHNTQAAGAATQPDTAEGLLREYMALLATTCISFPKLEERARRVLASTATAPSAPTDAKSAAPAAVGLTDQLRGMGWAVAVHNDYRLNGEAHTFWLFTKDGRAVKGEGRTDDEALLQVLAALSALMPAATSAPTDAKSAPYDQLPTIEQAEKLIEELDTRADHITRYSNSPDDGLMAAAARMIERLVAKSAAGVDLTEVFDWLDAELSAIDTVYRGSPTYDRDAGWMKDEVRDLLEKAREVFVPAAPSAQDSAAPSSVSAEPFAYYVYIPAEQRGELVHELDEATDDLTNCECEITELFDHPAPAAAPQAGEPVTPAVINALPQPLRDYIHELEARADPAGTVRELMQLRDTNAALQKMYRRSTDKLEECVQAALSHAGRPVAGEVLASALRYIIEREATPSLALAQPQPTKDEIQAEFEDWMERESPSGDVTEVQRQWEASSDYRDLFAQPQPGTGSGKS